MRSLAALTATVVVYDAAALVLFILVGAIAPVSLVGLAPVMLVIAGGAGSLHGQLRDARRSAPPLPAALKAALLPRLVPARA